MNAKDYASQLLRSLHEAKGVGVESFATDYLIAYVKETVKELETLADEPTPADLERIGHLATNTPDKAPLIRSMAPSLEIFVAGVLSVTCAAGVTYLRVSCDSHRRSRRVALSFLSLSFTSYSSASSQVP